MPVWEASGETRTGDTWSERIEAPSRAGLIADLERRGITPHRIEALGRRGERRQKPLRRAERSAFYAEIGALLEARIPVADALASLAQTAQTARLCALAEQLGERVQTGTDLSAALAETGVPDAETACLRAGEASGDPAAALLGLATTLGRREAVARALTGALIYPGVLLAVTLGSLAVILLGVVPNLAPLIAGPGRAPGLPARLLLGASDGLRAHWDVLLAGMVAAMGATVAALRWPGPRRRAERTLLGTPQIGPMLRESETAAALRIAGSLIAQGIPIPDAVDLAASATRLCGLRAGLVSASAEIRRGVPPDRALAGARALDAGSVGLVAIGLRTGRLAPMLETAAERLERAAEARIARLLAALPAALTLILGGLVGGISAIVLSAILGANDAAF